LVVSAALAQDALEREQEVVLGLAAGRDVLARAEPHGAQDHFLVVRAVDQQQRARHRDQLDQAEHLVRLPAEVHQHRLGRWRATAEQVAGFVHHALHLGAAALLEQLGRAPIVPWPPRS
jgi:hypothetical protein